MLKKSLPWEGGIPPPTRSVASVPRIYHMKTNRHLCLLHMEKFHTQLSVYTHKNSSVRPHKCGVKPYKFGGAQKVGQTPQSGQVICVYTEGQKAGLTPHVRHRNLCQHGIYGCTNTQSGAEVIFTSIRLAHAFLLLVIQELFYTDL